MFILRECWDGINFSNTEKVNMQVNMKVFFGGKYAILSYNMNEMRQIELCGTHIQWL